MNPTLPMFEHVPAARAEAAAEAQGEQLTARMRAPLASVSAIAGHMESHSPLFRGSAADPQLDIFAAAAAAPPSYASDGRCHNSEPGTFNHECGRPAVWIGTKPNGYQSGFCDGCKRGGYEARAFVGWERIGAAAEPAPTLPRKKHSHRCKACGVAVYCYKTGCTKGPRVDRCGWC